MSMEIISCKISLGVNNANSFYRLKRSPFALMNMQQRFTWCIRSLAMNVQYNSACIVCNSHDSQGCPVVIDLWDNSITFST